MNATPTWSLRRAIRTLASKRAWRRLEYTERQVVVAFLAERGGAAGIRACFVAPALAILGLAIATYAVAAGVSLWLRGVPEVHDRIAAIVLGVVGGVVASAPIVPWIATRKFDLERRARNVPVDAAAGRRAWWRLARVAVPAAIVLVGGLFAARAGVRGGLESLASDFTYDASGMRAERFGTVLDLDGGPDRAYYASSVTDPGGNAEVELWLDEAGEAELAHVARVALGAVLPGVALPLAVGAARADGPGPRVLLLWVAQDGAVSFVDAEGDSVTRSALGWHVGSAPQALATFQAGGLAVIVASTHRAASKVEYLHASIAIDEATGAATADAAGSESYSGTWGAHAIARHASGLLFAHAALEASRWAFLGPDVFAEMAGATQRVHRDGPDGRRVIARTHAFADEGPWWMRSRARWRRLPLVDPEGGLVELTLSDQREIAEVSFELAPHAQQLEPPEALAPADALLVDSHEGRWRVRRVVLEPGDGPHGVARVVVSDAWPR